ncbi:MAG: tRNA (N(6)-L-threonylcarbamoyladenosine(37)-C(2))-methylthiotransferase MtaB [Bacteroidales bacterium]|nr:tRNA (N(6)-L-threonylcarbamoyladenosine(37)-C(2))-methylthiotransferase MtaB [Bacteroidales bacterium]
MSKSIAFKTLGCRLNQYETDALASRFDKNNYRIVNYDDAADVYVVNTCTVTGQADHKSKQIVRQATKNNKDAVVVVAGCMVNNHREKLEESLDNVTYFVDNEEKSQIFDLIDAHYKGEVYHPKKTGNSIFSYEAADKTFHTRSMIKVQDGCDNFCTFCIIPKVRGRATSRPVDDILKNIKQVIGFGYKEIVLTGVNIGRYDYEGIRFEDLLERILELPGDFRVRISSIEADGFSKKLYELFRHPKLTPHLHLCLQSGSEKILLKMRRMYTAKEFRRIMDDIWKVVPDFNFTTDVIVGFPGETEEDFQETVDFVKDAGFSHIHTFKYSMRQETRAARMSDHITNKLKAERSEIIRKLADENKENYRRSFIGKTQQVLVEKIDEQGFARGYGEHYIPVKFKADNVQRNEFYDVRIDRLEVEDEPVLVGSQRL